MPAVTRLAPALLLPCAALAMAGCGTTKTIKASSARALVQKGLTAAHGGTAKSIDCPGDVEAKVGKTFKCHVQLQSGGTATFTLRVDSVSGNSGHITIVGARQP